MSWPSELLVLGFDLEALQPGLGLPVSGAPGPRTVGTAI